MDEFSAIFWPCFWAFLALVAAGAGFPIPEEIPTVGAGVWVGANPELGPLRWVILPVCFTGVLLSDLMLYSVGRWWGPRLLQYRWAKRLIPPETWKKIEQNYDQHGVTVLLMVRWLPAIRSPMFISAGIVRLSFVRFAVADGVALVFGHSLLFFLACWFGDSFQDLIVNAEHEVNRLKPLIILLALAGVAGFLLHHFLRRPVSTGDPQELPLIGEKVAHTIEHLSGELNPPKPPASPTPPADGAVPESPGEREGVP